MKMIISAHIEVDPNKREAALTQAVPAIEATLEEPGCIHYNWASDSSNPQLITVYEEWESEATLDLHFTTDNFKKMHQILGECGLISANATKFSVSQEGPVFKDGAPTSEF